MNYDQKLIKNVLDEINRLNSQLADLETYKDELPQEEIESIKKETLEQLINNNKLLEKMKTGDLTTKTALEDAQQKINAILIENYNSKELLNSYLVGEANFLREKLKKVQRDYALNKIKVEEYELNVSYLLEAIAKSNNLNEEEKKLYDSIKKKVMNKYEVDQGVDKSSII